MFTGDMSSGVCSSAGLTTTDGHKIYLEKEGDLIVGRVDSDNDGSVSTAEIAAFAIAIDPTSGDVSEIGRASCRERAAEVGVAVGGESNTMGGKVSAGV